MEIITNNKGGEKLCYNGYVYTKKSVSTTKKHWECSKRKGLSCKGKLTTDFDLQSVLSTVEHNHAPNVHAIEALKVRQALKQQAAGAKTGYAEQMLYDVMAGMTQEERLALGPKDSIMRSIRRHRKTGRSKNLLSTLHILPKHSSQTQASTVVPLNMIPASSHTLLPNKDDDMFPTVLNLKPVPKSVFSNKGEEKSFESSDTVPVSSFHNLLPLNLKTKAYSTLSDCQEKSHISQNHTKFGCTIVKAPVYDANISFLPKSGDEEFIALLGLEQICNQLEVHVMQHFRTAYICSKCKTDYSVYWTKHVNNGVMCNRCTNYYLQQNSIRELRLKSLLEDDFLPNFAKKCSQFRSITTSHNKMSGEMVSYDMPCASYNNTVILSTNQNKRKIEHQGYYYVKHKDLSMPTHSSWICERKNTLKCKGRLRVENNGNIPINTVSEHNHQPNTIRKGGLLSFTEYQKVKNDACNLFKHVE